MDLICPYQDKLMSKYGYEVSIYEQNFICDGLLIHEPHPKLMLLTVGKTIKVLWSHVFIRRSIVISRKYSRFLCRFVQITFKSCHKTRFWALELLILYKYFTILRPNRDFLCDKLFGATASQTLIVVCTLQEAINFLFLYKVDFIQFSSLFWINITKF